MRRLIKRLLLNPPNAFDSDAQAYITAAGITNISHQNAINTYVLGLKSAGLWSKIIARYITYNSATTAAINMKSPTQFLCTIVGSPTIDSTGYLANASSYVRTGIIPSTHLTTNNIHVGHWQLNAIGSGSFSIGCNQGTSQRLGLVITGSNGVFDSYSTVSGRCIYLGDIRNGYTIGSRISSTSAAIYSNGTSLATTNTVSGSVPDVELVFDGVSGGTSGSTTYTPQGSARKYMMATIGAGLTDAEALTDYNLTLTLKNSLGL